MILKRVPAFKQKKKKKKTPLNFGRVLFLRDNFSDGSPIFLFDVHCCQLVYNKLYSTFSILQF